MSSPLARQRILLALAFFCNVYCPVAQCPTTEWVDPDTPASACTGKVDRAGDALELVFSDEFNVDGRTFEDGDDPRWTAHVGFPDTNSQVNSYSDLPEFATTSNGMLQMKAAARQTRLVYHAGYGWESATRGYTTQMLQGWNKFCYTEGVLELSAQLPGRAHQSGLWPAAWLFGNLGRATQKNSTEKLWPWSYNHCPDAADEEANQYVRTQQVINACLGAEFTDQYGLNPNQGRGAIEIDIIEVCTVFALTQPCHQCPARCRVGEGTLHPVGHYWVCSVEPPVCGGDQAPREPTLGPLRPDQTLTEGGASTSSPKFGCAEISCNCTQGTPIWGAENSPCRNVPQPKSHPPVCQSVGRNQPRKTYH